MPSYVKWTIFGFWLLNCVLGVASVVAPYVMGLHKMHAPYYLNLWTTIVWGALIPPIIFLLMKFFPLIGSQKWLCFISPLFLFTALYFAYVLLNAPSPTSLWLTKGVETKLEELTIRYDRFEEKTVSPYGQEPSSYATYFLEIKSGGETHPITLGEHEKSVGAKWKGHHIFLDTMTYERSQIHIFITQDQ